MPRVVVPVRYPLSEHSKATLRDAIEEAEGRDADLTVLHVALYQDDAPTTRTQLKGAVEREFGNLSRARYVVRKGFLVEETILDEVAAEDADVVVIGGKQAGRWRRALRRIFDEPDIEGYLKRELDCEVVVVRS